EDGIRDKLVTGVQTCALPISTPTSASVRTACMIVSRLPILKTTAQHCPDQPRLLHRESQTLPGLRRGCLGTDRQRRPVRICSPRSEERRVGKECMARGWAEWG